MTKTEFYLISLIGAGGGIVLVIAGGYVVLALAHGARSLLIWLGS